MRVRSVVVEPGAGARRALTQRPFMATVSSGRVLPSPPASNGTMLLVSGDEADSSHETPGSSDQGVENFFWPLFALVLVILPQVLVPARMRLGPPSEVPLVEALLVVVLLGVAAKRGPVPRAARPLVLSLFALLALANTLAAGRLVIIVLRGSHESGAPPTAGRLLMATAIMLATNIVTFALIYWQVDGGGPAARQTRSGRLPDFMFPQTTAEGLAPIDWRPRFPDHLYLSFTNVVAFSPTDTLPLTIRAKGLMALQSLISLTVLVVVVSRVINILPPPA